MNDYKELINKKVKIFLRKENIAYSGRVLSVSPGFIKIYDRFDAVIYVPIDNISSIEELK
jgi:hypothetical protein